jgi:DNA-binding NtrC family response regulator
MPKRILVVDNDLRSREIIARFLRESGYEVEQADDGLKAIAMLSDNGFALLICDVVMPQLGAFELIGRMRSLSLSTAVILISGHPDLLAQQNLPPLPYLSKPFNMYDLLRLVEKSIVD